MHATIQAREILGRQAPDRRSQARSEVALPILISLGLTRYSATLHDLSTTGAMIETTAPLAVANLIEFQCGSICTSGSVLWQEGSSFGIKFGEPLTDPQLSEQVVRSKALARRRRRPSVTLPNHAPVAIEGRDPQFGDLVVSTACLLRAE